MLLSDLAVGTKVADVNSKYNNKIIMWTVASKNHYGNNQVTLISDVLALKPSDAKEAGNSNSRNTYGNNRYSLSNIHSWLNSNKDNWYEAKHSLDAPPVSSLVTANPYDTEKGFCTNLSSKFLNKVKTTTITTALPTCDGGGSENISCKFFLPSLMEVGLGQENGISEGSQFPLFTDNASRIIEFGGASREWELRTPASNNGYDFRHIRPNGTNYTNIANNGYLGIRTVCNIDANIEVENKNSYYELKLSSYLSDTTSLKNVVTELENKKEITKQLRTNLYNILNDKGVEVKEDYTLTALINEVKDISNINVKVYNKLPSVVENGQIVLISDKYNNVYISKEEPSMDNNDIWIKKNDDGIEFKVSSKNVVLNSKIYGAVKKVNSETEPIASYIGVDGEWIYMGSYYLFKENKGNSYSHLYDVKISDPGISNINIGNDKISLGFNFYDMASGKSTLKLTSKNLIDLSMFNRFYFDFDSNCKSNYGTFIVRLINESKSTVASYTVGLNESRNLRSIDVSKVNVRCKFEVYGELSTNGGYGSVSRNMNLYNIYFE